MVARPPNMNSNGTSVIVLFGVPRDEYEARLFYLIICKGKAKHEHRTEHHTAR
jgi:hypothetical protein